MKTLIKEIVIENENVIPFPILPNGPGWQSTEINNLAVIESGPKKELLSRIINGINNAKHMICIQSFLFQDSEIIDSLIEAVHKRSVKVFILSSADARLGSKIDEESDFIKDKYIKLLDTRFKNNFVHRSADNFHAKYILIDPKTNPIGYICTNNFTINGFVNNPELSVELNKAQCEELFKIFVYHFWEHAKDEQTSGNEFEIIKSANIFKLDKTEKILLTSPNKGLNNLNDELINAVQKSNKSISLSTFMVDKNTQLMQMVIEKAKNKIPVVLFCRPIERLINDHLKELVEAGLQVIFHPLMHAKSLLIDDKFGFIFTANITSEGLSSGMEIGIELNDHQSKALSAIHQNWGKTFPYTIKNNEKISNLSEYIEIRNNQLQKHPIIIDTKEFKQPIKSVSDLLSFFNKKREINDKNIKEIKITLKADIEIYPQKIKTKPVHKYEILDVQQKDGKKSKSVVINDSFQAEDINELEKYKNHKIYFAN